MNNSLLYGSIVYVTYTNYDTNKKYYAISDGVTDSGVYFVEEKYFMTKYPQSSGFFRILPSLYFNNYDKIKSKLNKNNNINQVFGSKDNIVKKYIKKIIVTQDGKK